MKRDHGITGLSEEIRSAAQRGETIEFPNPYRPCLTMPKKELRNQIYEAVVQLNKAQRRFLESCGWSQSAGVLPLGNEWLWQKEINGRVVATSALSAIVIEDDLSNTH